MLKTFHQLDRDGVYIGSFEVENFIESIDETPPHCTDISPPTLTDGQQARFVAGTWEVEPKPVYAAVMQPYEEAAAVVRTRRNMLLSESDYTQLPDVNVDRASWGAYRDKLRDISSQDGFPFSVVWPEKPE